MILERKYLFQDDLVFRRAQHCRRGFKPRLQGELRKFYKFHLTLVK